MDYSRSFLKLAGVLSVTPSFSARTTIFAFVKSIVIGMKSKFLRLYYFVSAPIPRRIPRTDAELEALLDILTRYYGLENASDVRLTVCGQLTALPPTKMRKSYGSLANAGKRLRINSMLQSRKQVEIKKLEDRLKELTEQVSHGLEANSDTNQVVS